MGRLDHVKALEAAGFVLVPLRGKAPYTTNWQATAHGEFLPSELAQSPTYGIVLTAELLVLDVDPRNFAAGDRPLGRLVAAIGGLPPTFTVRSGGGGLHAYYRKPADVCVRNGLKEYPGLEFKSVGRQMVGPGSIHPDSGKEYVVTAGDPSSLAQAPQALLDLIQRSEVPFSDFPGTGTYVNDAATQGRFADYLAHTAEPSVQGKGGDANAFKVAVTGRDMALPPVVVYDLMLEVWNKRCAPPWPEEELKAKVINAYKYASGSVGASHPSADFAPIVTAQPTAVGLEDKIGWVLTKGNKVVKCFQNTLNFLRVPEGGFKDIFALSEFTGRYEYVAPAPWHKGKLPQTRSVGDMDLKLLKGYLALRHGYEVSVSEIEEAISNVAYYRRFHPVRQWLGSVKWDGVKRLDTWLHDFLGVADSPYSRACAAKVLCAAVARVYEPGVKFDHVLVLEGAQDVGKSTAIEILGGQWAADAAVDPHNRDTIDMMQGRWIIELAEMEVVRKVDEDALKAFITRKKDLARLAYGRSTGEFPRQSIFIATKNPRADGTYLRDETGGRRWWPVRCTPRHGAVGSQIDFKGLKAARNQLFAEAVVRYLAGEKLYMETLELKDAAREEAAARLIVHEWTERITLWLAEQDRMPETRRDFLTTRDIFVDCMGGVDKHLDRRSTTAIASVLRTLGWHSGFKRIGGHTVRGYRREVPLIAHEEEKALDVLVGL